MRSLFNTSHASSEHASRACASRRTASCARISRAAMLDGLPEELLTLILDKADLGSRVNASRVCRRLHLASRACKRRVHVDLSDVPDPVTTLWELKEWARGGPDGPVINMAHLALNYFVQRSAAPSCNWRSLELSDSSGSDSEPECSLYLPLTSLSHVPTLHSLDLAMTVKCRLYGLELCTALTHLRLTIPHNRGRYVRASMAELERGLSALRGLLSLDIGQYLSYERAAMPTVSPDTWAQLTQLTCLVVNATDVQVLVKAGQEGARAGRVEGSLPRLQRLSVQGALGADVAPLCVLSKLFCLSPQLSRLAVHYCTLNKPHDSLGPALEELELSECTDWEQVSAALEPSTTLTRLCILTVQFHGLGPVEIERLSAYSNLKALQLSGSVNPGVIRAARLPLLHTLELRMWAKVYLEQGCFKRFHTFFAHLPSLRRLTVEVPEHYRALAPFKRELARVAAAQGCRTRLVFAGAVFWAWVIDDETECEPETPEEESDGVPWGESD